MSVKLEDVIEALEGEIQDQKVAIEKAQAHIEWAQRIIGWLRSGQLPGPRGDTTRLFPCIYAGCTFVAATPAGLKHHKTVVHGEKPDNGPVDETEEDRRRAVYNLRLTDRVSAERLGISPQAYQIWRRKRELPPWRGRGSQPRAKEA